MEDLLISTLEPLGYPVLLQGSILPDESYPDSFFTFWNDASNSTSYYSNKENGIEWEYSLNFYSTDPLLTNSKLLEAKALLKSAGWVVNGAGYDVASDEPTHTGRGITILYRQ